MKIHKLPSDARSKLQSGLVITDLVQCVLELVYNSLDAEATGIAVRVDLKDIQIRVIDNGKGIEKEDLEYVGNKFMTSKYSSYETESTTTTYGYKGQALSSILDVCSSLTIETKSENDGPTFVKVFKNKKALPIEEVESKREGTGTSVTVEDFMCTLPVRKKRISEVFDFEEIKVQLQYLAVIHYNVCFTLRNESKAVILLQTSQASSIREAISNIYGKSLAKSLESVNYQEQKYKITGFISLKPQAQNNIQLLYVNKRLITKGTTHKFINNLLKEYIGKKSLNDGTPLGQLFKSLKNCFYNVFILEVQCPFHYYELFSNIRKTTVEFKNWKEVLRCIHRAVKKTFKEILSLDSSNSDNQEDKVIKNKCKNGEQFGTSVLINAVKGVPAKRRDITKHKKIKKRMNESKKKSDVQYTENVIKSICAPVLDITNPKDSFHDTLESPIPKCIKSNSIIKAKSSTTFNQTESEFYEWMKSKFETDPNAFNLYNDFLQFKNRLHCVEEISDLKSPVLGGKPKKSVVKKLKNKSENSFNFLKNDMETVFTPSKIFEKSCVTNKRVSKLSVGMKSIADDIESLNLETSFFKKPYNVPRLTENQQQPDRILPSLHSSEIQLTNVIEFRNLPESFFQEPPNIRHRDTRKVTLSSSDSNTWVSHYKHSEKNLYENRYFWPKMNDSRRVEGFELQDFSLPSIKSLMYKEEIAVQDAEIQVDFTEGVKKANAVVQTIPIIGSSGYENDEINNKIDKSAEISLKDRCSQEVPQPDFWNTTVQSDILYCNNQKETNTNAFTNEKISTSSEFFCGHKSNSLTKTAKEKSISKDTQTLAAIWADSLMEINCSSENKCDSGATQLPDTIPATEIEFCLTERHDVIPKGLSPNFTKSEASKNLTLSPTEKNKIKNTIENIENDLLATIKWQNETTGDAVKPTIPDNIMHEMRRKSVRDYDNQVLSASLSCCAVKVHNLLHSFTFTKEVLSNVEILGQLDKKFIVTKMKLSIPKNMVLISLFDQHAVDERIKLEDLIGEYTLPDGKIISSELNPSIECILTESDVRIISSLNEKLCTFGLNVKTVNDNTVSFSSIPRFFFNKHERILKSKKNNSLSDTLKALIVNIVNEITETRGAFSRMPKVLHNALCMEACHKAIRFNKALSLEDMTDMINKLESCKLPFQCAHGRPSVIPIIDLEDFNSMNKKKKNIDLEKLKKFYNERKACGAVPNIEIVNS